MKKLISALLATSMVTLSLAGCSAPASTTGSSAAGNDSSNTSADAMEVIIACNALNQDHMYNIGLNEFKKVAEEVSGGKLKVTAHAGTIGTDESELVEKLQMNAANIVVASPGFMASAGIPEVDLLSLYYLFDSIDSWEACVSGEFGQKFADLINQKSNNQFKILNYWSSGIRNYYGKKPVTSPADLEGIKIRCQTAQAVKDFWSACGAIPTAVSWNELYQALEQGVVDAAENDYVSFSQKDHHKTKNGHYITETQHTFLTPVLMTTGAWYDGLTDEQRGWIDTAVEAATKAEHQATWDLAGGAKELVIKDGAEVTENKDVDIEAFKAIAVPIQDKFAEDYNVKDLLDLIRSYSK